MSTSSARPLDLLDYMAGTGAQHEAMPATAELDRLVGVMMRSPNVEFFTACYPTPGDGVLHARQLAQELDMWVGVVATGFMEADGGADPGLAVTVDDGDVIAAMPPLMGDPPAEVRERVEEGEELYDRLAQAAADRDHDAIEEIMAEIDERSGDEALMAGFAAAIAEAGSQEDFEAMLEDGMRPENRPGFWGGVADFFAGAWDAVWGTVTFLWDVSVVRMIFDDDGWREDVDALATGLWHGITNPLELIEAIVDLDGLEDNPERWFGALAPDAVLAYFTAGSATAARRGVGATGALRRLGDYLHAIRNLRPVDLDAGSYGTTLRTFNRLLRDFDGDIVRTRDAMRRYLENRTDLSPQQINAFMSWAVGTAFDNQRRGTGTEISQVELGPPGSRDGVRLDAWDPVAGEIISNKFTQLADITTREAIDYLEELPAKYAPGQEVKITPTVRAKAEAAGLDPVALWPDGTATLSGRYVLVVPSQAAAIPQAVIDRAVQLRITIRDTDGTVLVGR